jgi:hypothetical protein
MEQPRWSDPLYGEKKNRRAVKINHDTLSTVNKLKVTTEVGVSLKFAKITEEVDMKRYRTKYKNA